MSHIAQLEEPTARIYNYVLAGFGEKKKKKKRLAADLAQVPILEKNKDTVRRYIHWAGAGPCSTESCQRLDGLARRVYRGHVDK